MTVEEPEEQNKGQSLSEFAANFKINMSKAGSILLSLNLVFLITFVVFPGTFMAAKLEFWEDVFKNEEASKREAKVAAWTFNFVATFFSIFDTVGRVLGGRINTGKNTTIFMSLFRLIFIATTVGTVIPWPPASLFGEDWFKITNLLLFAFSNGFVSTRCAVIAPKLVDQDQRATIGLFTSLMLGFGINLGSVVALFMGGLQPKDS